MLTVPGAFGPWAALSEDVVDWHPYCHTGGMRFLNRSNYKRDFKQALSVSLGGLLALSGVLRAGVAQAQTQTQTQIAAPVQTAAVNQGERERFERRLQALEDEIKTLRPAQVAAKSAAAAWFEAFELHGSVDVYYGYNFNRPIDGDNFTSGAGTTAKKANDVNLNLAAIELFHDAKPVGLHLILNYGTGSEVLYAAEPQGNAMGAQAFKLIQQASLSYRAPWGRGLLLEAGIYPSHIGFEVFPSQGNWSYTRSWMAEFSPYYQAGLKLSYNFTDQLSAQLHVMNGWQLIGENNAAKAIGTQLAWNHEKVSVTFNTFFGPELANDNKHWRVFGDLIVVVRPLPWLNLSLSADVGHQQLPQSQSALWHTVYGSVRFMPRQWLALTLRAGYFGDDNGLISGAAQTLLQADATLELRLHDHLLIKLEGRYDHSTAPVFSASKRAPTGEVLRVDQQGLMTLGVVAYF